MKIDVVIKVTYDDDEQDEAFELCDELYEYEQTFVEDFEDHEVTFNVIDSANL